MQNMNLAMVVLIAGLIIVFVMLILLTLIIKLYGTIIYKKQVASKTKKTEKSNSNVVNTTSVPSVAPNFDDLSDEIVAVISAAVASLGAANSKYYAIKSIKQSLNPATLNRSEWSMAGKFQNTKPFWN